MPRRLEQPSSVRSPDALSRVLVCFGGGSGLVRLHRVTEKQRSCHAGQRDPGQLQQLCFYALKSHIHYRKRQMLIRSKSRASYCSRGDLPRVLDFLLVE
jgi:hypothetical protein